MIGRAADHYIYPHARRSNAVRAKFIFSGARDLGRFL